MGIGIHRTIPIARVQAASPPGPLYMGDSTDPDAGCGTSGFDSVELEYQTVDTSASEPTRRVNWRKRSTRRSHSKTDDPVEAVVLD